jgi:hypothetical protein
VKILSRVAMVSVALASAAFSTPAIAGTGCNGVVNIFVWGCAPWDNNNGSQFPYFRKKVTTLPAQGTQIVTERGVQMALRNGTYYPLIGQDGAGFRVWSQ